jgi:hypothetical protein
MIAFDPDQIIVEDNGREVDFDKKMLTEHWQMRIPKQGGTAWIRITPELRDFLKLRQEKHGVIGFEYDFEEAGLNFGLVLKDGNA